jgi:hypothetical protein
MLLCVNTQGLVLFLGKLFFCMFLNLNNMILTHAKDFFCEENGPNLSDLKINKFTVTRFLEQVLEAVRPKKI